ncbi:MAG: RIO1 family regulatory kinase/ATPase [Candidatus Binataceae bacterium]
MEKSNGSCVLWRRMVDNIRLWLAADRIHADLSPYNVLYWRGDIRVIDFPQAVDPRFNTDARRLLERDLANMTRYFARFGVEADSSRMAHAIWSSFVRNAL